MAKTTTKNSLFEKIGEGIQKQVNSIILHHKQQCYRKIWVKDFMRFKLLGELYYGLNLILNYYFFVPRNLHTFSPTPAMFQLIKFALFTLKHYGFWIKTSRLLGASFCVLDMPEHIHPLFARTTTESTSAHLLGLSKKLIHIINRLKTVYRHCLK